MTFTLPGFATVKREGVQLTGEFVASVNADMRVGGVEETITVSGDAPLVDVQSATRQSVMDRAMLDVLPSASGNLSNVAALIPGIVANAVDVGGLSGVGRGATVSAHGVVNMQQQFNGLSLSAANGGASGSVTNMAAYQELAIDTEGGGAENKEGGVRLQFIPRDGGNMLAGSMQLSFANRSIQSSNFTSDLKQRGLGTPNELDKIFRAGTRRVTPQLDIYNLLNSNVVTTLSNAYATWLRPQGIMPPRLVKVDLQLNF